MRMRQFVASKDPKKREKLVDTLLASPEFVDYWTFRFADLFRVAVFPSRHQSKVDQRVLGMDSRQHRANRPYNEIAMERISAQGYSAPSRHFLPY